MKTKRFLFKFITFLSLVFVGTACSLKVYASDEIKVAVDNKYIDFDVPPMLIGGRTMVPLRAILEAIGAEVVWDDAASTVTAYNQMHIVTATIGSDVITADGVRHSIDVPPMLVENRTLVPARFVAEAFGCGVEWDANSLTVNITTVPLDYTKVERDIMGLTENGAEKSNSKEYEYYPDSIVPDYSYVTGKKLADFRKNSRGTRIYVYEYNQSEFDKYYAYLEKEGWDIYDYNSNDESLIVTYYMLKDGKLISLIENFKYHQVWITL